MAVALTILGSGSGGNCAYLEAGETRLLIDAGLSGRQIRQRLAGIGRSPETLTGILITHEHSDHTQGLAALGARLSIPVYCNRFTQESLLTQVKLPLTCRLFATGSSFEVGEVVVDTFSVPHDAQDPVGFLVRTSAGNVGFLTDLGHVTRLVVERVRPATALLVETNHDVHLLQNDTRRPWSLKQRILSRFGHLCNDAAAEAMDQLASETLRHLYLGHLSRDCNRPELAHGVMRERLDRLGAHHIRVEVTSQETPNPTLWLSAPVATGIPSHPVGAGEAEPGSDRAAKQNG